MEDQGKRLILAVVAAMGIFLLWQVIFPSKKEEPPKAGSGSAPSAQVQTQDDPLAPTPVAPAGSGSSAGSGSNAATASPESADQLVTHPRNPADELTIELPEYRAVFSKWGG